MNKKTLIIPTLILAAGVAAMGFSTQASAAGFNLGAALGFGGGSNNANVSVRADANDDNGGHSNGQGSMMQHDMMPGVFGTVTAINGDTITVQSKGWGQNTTTTSYTVNASAATVTKANVASSVSSIAIGDTIMVQGTVSGSTVTATKINDGLMMPQGGRGVFGTVTAVSGNTITITSKGFGSNATPTTYTVNASGATVMKANAASSISSIAVGDTIVVQGTVSGSTVNATKINDGVMPNGDHQPGNKGGATIPNSNGQPIIGGTVTAVSGNTVTITNKSNISYSIDVASASITKNGTASTVSGIAVGDNVLAQGTVNGTSVTAVSLVDSATVSGSNSGHHGFLGAIGAFFAKFF